MPFDVEFGDDISDENVGKSFECFTIKEILCKVMNAEETTVNSGLNAALTFELLCVEGEHDGELVGRERLMFHTKGLLERALFVLIRLGIPEAQLRAKGFQVTPELVNNRKTRVTTKIERSCGGEGCFAKVIPHEKEGDTIVYKCTACAWQGDDPYEKMAPDYSGYDFASAEDHVENKAADGEVDNLDDLDF